MRSHRTAEVDSCICVHTMAIANHHRASTPGAKDVRCDAKVRFQTRSERSAEGPTGRVLWKWRFANWSDAIP